MSQNLISMELSAPQWAEVDAALAVLERTLAGLVGLTPEQRQRLTKMGDRSEAFCRRALDVMGENPAVLAGNFDLAEVRRDLAAFDALRPRVVRLQRLVEKAADSQMALGSDVMAAALEGYAFLKIAGRGEGLDGLRRTLSARFDRSTAPSTPATPPPTTVPA